MKTCEWGYIVENGGLEPCDNLCEGSTSYCPRHNRIMRQAETQTKKDAEKLARKLSAPQVKYMRFPENS